MAPKNDTMKHINLSLTTELHRLIKMTAVEKEITMSNYIRDAIIDQLKRDGKI